MKQTILSSWNFMRLIRLGMGIAIIIQGVATKDIMFSAIGLLLTGMVVLNIGCCGASGCYTPVEKNSGSTKEIIYEEVLNDK